MGQHAFSQYNGSKSHASGHFRLPESIEYIGTNCFSGFGDNLEGEIIIPTSFTSVPFSIFENMSFPNGTNLTFHDNVVRIGARAFSDIQFNNKIVWPASIVSIGDDAFFGCMCLCAVEIPYGVKSIGDRAFQSCPLLSLSNVAIPNSVTNIGDKAFDKDVKLRIKAR